MKKALLIDEIKRLKDIIRRAKFEFFRDGEDSIVAANMLKVLLESESEN